MLGLIRRPLMRRLAILVPFVLLVSAMGVTPVKAYAPYTHIDTATSARDEMIANNGSVIIAGRPYAVNPLVFAAIRDYPTYYNAGVVGPDGFPDLVMGQGIIHPHNTGLWLSYLLKKAWEAQDDSLNSPPYTAAEKSQILAFTYGYLTHAAGDTWAHTLVNQFSGGPFPNLGTNLFTNPSDLGNAIKHELVEFYIEDATPGFDGNQFDNRKVLPDGDISDESTPARPLDAPIRFIYETLVRHNGDEPAPERGAVLDFFFNLRATLAAHVVPMETGKTLQSIANDYNSLKTQLNDLLSSDCDFGDDGVVDFGEDLVACPAALLSLGFDAVITGVEDFAKFVASALHDALASLLNAYLNAWIDDIDQGLQHWGELGLGISRGIFDPQARRDLQNDPGIDGCGSVGPDSTDIASARGSCEDAITKFGTVMHTTESFRLNHLLSMLGLPDLVGDALTALGEAADLLAEILGPIANPLRETKAQITEAVKSMIEDFIKQRFGIDIPQLEAFFKSPSSKMDVTTIPIDTPAGTINVQLFKPTDHALLDHYLGITEPYPTSPGGGLGDSVTFDQTKFAAWQDTVMMAKLLLLDGPTLDNVLSDNVGHTVHLYGTVPHGNIMTTPLSTIPASQLNDPTQTTEWLRIIDGDHAWRKDGLPIFSDPLRFEGPSGGNNNFPLWKSCILRDKVFRALFKDWENDNFVPTTPGDSANFPNYGDNVGPDPNDPNPPSSTLTLSGANYTAGGVTYVGGQTSMTIQAHDGFWSDNEINLNVNVTGPSGTQLSGSVANGSSFTLSGPDGTYTVTFAGQDPCGTETTHVQTFVLDTTPPATAVTAAAGAPATGGRPISSIGATTATANPGGIKFGPATCFNTAGLVLNLHASDAGSGVASISYTVVYRKTPGQPAVTTTGQVSGADVAIPVTAEGQTSVTYQSTDNLGNQEAAKEQLVFVSAHSNVACTAPKPVLPATFPGSGSVIFSGTLSNGNQTLPFTAAFGFTPGD